MAFLTNKLALPDQTPWAVIQLKRRARELARSLGHSLERFRHFEDRALTGRRPDYWFTYCASCAASVGLSPSRWPTHTIAGRAIREECPAPVAELEELETDAA